MYIKICNIYFNSEFVKYQTRIGTSMVECRLHDCHALYKHSDRLTSGFSYLILSYDLEVAFPNQSVFNNCHFICYWNFTIISIIYIVFYSAFFSWNAQEWRYETLYLLIIIIGSSYWFIGMSFDTFFWKGLVFYI